MRLIDIDPILAWANDPEVQEPYGVRGSELERKLRDAPTIDAVSVVHGEWKPNPKIGWGETWVCSICGEKTTSSVMGYPRYNYCPMCGARMKGADDE